MLHCLPPILAQSIWLGLAGSGARGDLPAAQFELLASIILLVLGWVFVPLYLKSGVFTMPEFLEKRYSKSARNYLALISILAYIFTKISITIFAGALVFEVLGIPFWTGATIVVLVTGLYTVLGGLKAVLYTDLMQMVILLIGSFAITIYGIGELGGISSLIEVLTASSDSQGSIQHLNLWRTMSDPDFPWTGIILGAPILGIWYWCTDQYIVQRVLSAKNVSEARKGNHLWRIPQGPPFIHFCSSRDHSICSVSKSQWDGSGRFRSGSSIYDYQLTSGRF